MLFCIGALCPRNIRRHQLKVYKFLIRTDVSLPETDLSIEVKQEFQRSLFKVRKEAVVMIKEKGGLR